MTIPPLSHFAKGNNLIIIIMMEVLAFTAALYFWSIGTIAIIGFGVLVDTDNI